MSAASSRSPDDVDFREAWARLDKPARRRVRRAVNRAQPAEDPTEAALAATMAAGQRRMWRYAWLFGPAVAALLQIPAGWQAVVANALFATALFGFMGFIFSWKAKRAEAANRAVVEEARAKRRNRSRGQAKPPSKRRGGSKSRKKRKRGR